MDAFSAQREPPEWVNAYALEWVGDFDRVDADGVIEGWCWCPEKPRARATIVIKLDGVPVGSARSDTMRPDLAANGMGDGGYGFLIIVPADILSVKRDARVSLHDCATGRLICMPRKLRCVALQNDDVRSKIENATESPPILEGNLDGVSSDGVVSGWCWYPLQPDKSVSVTVAVDGHVMGTTRAAIARGDLRKANIGDGAHGFSFALSTSLLETTGQIRVSVTDAATGQNFGVPCVARLGQLAATQDRLADIEHCIRRIGADFAAFVAAETLRAARSPVTDLLNTLGCLFQEMALDHNAASAHPVWSLPTSGLATANNAVAELVLAVPSHPKVTLIVPVCGDTAELWACLNHLHAEGIDQQAEIILLDHGTSPSTAMLHASIRNLRVAVDQDADLPAWIERLSRQNQPIVFLAPLLRPGPFWLDRLLAIHHAQPNAAVVGGLVAGVHDGLLRSAGTKADDHDLPHEAGQFELAESTTYRCLREVDAVSALGFLISPDAIASTSFDPDRQILLQPAEAVLDLCLHFRRAGRSILIQPAALSHCADGADLNSYIVDFGRCPANLREAWFSRPRLSVPIARILVINAYLPARAAAPGHDRDIEFLRILGEAKFDVTITATSGIPQDADAEWLESQGITVFRAHEAVSICTMLLGEGMRFDIIAFTAKDPPALLVDRVRLLASHAKIVQIGTMQDACRPLTRRARTRLRQIVQPGRQRATYDQRQGIIFVADFAQPDHEAALRSFVTNVMPRIQAEHPKMPLHILGEGASYRLVADIVQGCDSDLVSILPASAITRLRHQVRIVLVLDRNGADNGLGLSLAASTPVISVARSPTEMPSLDLGIVSVDTPDQLVKVIVSIYDDQPAWETQSARAIHHCKVHFLPDATFWLSHDRAFGKGMVKPPY